MNIISFLQETVTTAAEEVSNIAEKPVNIVAQGPIKIVSENGGKAAEATKELPTQSFADKAIDFLQTSGIEFLQKLVVAILIFAIGKFIAAKLTQVSEKLMEKSKVDETLRKFLCTIIYAMLIVLVVLSALSTLGVNTTSFAAIVAAGGLAIGLALKDSLSNFASGVMIIMFKPYKVGDFVNMAGTAGIVKEVHIFNTFLRTPDNREIIVPNGAITSGNIENFSKTGTRRIDLVFTCGYNDDLKEVVEFLRETIVDHEDVLKDPEPVVAVADLADSGININFRPWVKTENYWAVRSDFLERVKLGFDERGYTIPYPTQELNLVTKTVQEEPKSKEDKE